MPLTYAGTWLIKVRYWGMMSTKAHNKNTSDSPSSSLKSDAEALKLKSDEAADLLSAMSNAKRLLILCNLVEGEMPVGQLAETVGLSQSALSQHLAKLRARKLVSTRRDAQTIYYSIASESVYQVLETIGDIFLSSRPTRMAQATAKPATVG
ncbi:Transcriptional regulator (modular protein) [Rhizobium sp. EC-SD404]|nr:Transcriptional regulator (modular protein) [Rhizobium sp. EC-SD404]